jgi:hypothetical protein
MLCKYHFFFFLDTPFLVEPLGKVTFKESILLEPLNKVLVASPNTCGGLGLVV